MGKKSLEQNNAVVDLKNIVESPEEIFSDKEENTMSMKIIDNIKELSDDSIFVIIINNNIELLEYILKKNKCNFNREHLEIACKYSDIKTILFFLNQKIESTQKCFEYCLNREFYKFVNKNSYYVTKYNEPYYYFYYLGEKWDCIFSDDEPVFDIKKYSYNKKDKPLFDEFGNDIYYPNKNIEEFEMLNILCSYGYKITQNDFYELTKRGIYIKNYKKLKLKLDDTIKNICETISVYPYEKIPYSYESYKKVFKSNDVKILKKIEKKYNFEPNTECLENLFLGYTYDTATLKLLQKYNEVDINLNCLKLAIEAKKEKCTNYLIEELIKKEIVVIKNKKNKISEKVIDEYNKNKLHFSSYLFNDCNYNEKDKNVINFFITRGISPCDDMLFLLIENLIILDNELKRLVLKYDITPFSVKNGTLYYSIFITFSYIHLLVKINI